jgi:glycosyltransferase 2 family protein
MTRRLDVAPRAGGRNNRAVRGFPEAARWGLRIAVTGGLVAWLLVHVDRDAIWRALAGVRLGWLAIAIALYVAGQLLSAFKWTLLGRSVGLDGSFGEYARFYFIGMFFNLLGISTLGGDVVRALYLGRGRWPALALNSVVFDRISGLAILMGLGAVMLLAFPAYRFPLPLTAAMIGGGSALVVGWWTCPRLVRLLPERAWVRRQVEGELAPFWRDRALLARVAAVSLAFHLSQVGVQWLLGQAVGAPLPFACCLVFHPVLSVAMALPVSVGGFGVREAAYVRVLAPVGVAEPVAVGIGLLWWTVTVVAALVGGVVFFVSGAALPALRLRDDRRATA